MKSLYLPYDQSQACGKHSYISVPAGTGLYSPDLVLQPRDPENHAPLNQILQDNSHCSVTLEFRSSLDGAPENALDVSATGRGQVLLWWKTEKQTSLSMIVAGNGMVFAPEYSEGLFASDDFLCSAELTEIRFNGAFDTSLVTDMSSMFQNCKALKHLDLSCFDTGKVCCMDGMFNGCLSLDHLDLSSFDTGKVCTMDAMFQNCTALTELSIRNFNMRHVLSTTFMFDHCSSLKELDLSAWDMSSVCNMCDMFAYCSALHTVKQHFYTPGLICMNSLFFGCRSLQHLDLSSWKLDNVNNMDYAFWGCQMLQRLELPVLPDSAVPASTKDIFKGCSKQLELSAQNTFFNNALHSQACFSSDLVLRNYAPDGNSACVFGSRIPRNSVLSITFLHSLTEAPADALDISESGNGQVLLWSQKSTAGVHLFIGGNARIYAPENSAFLFGGTRADNRTFYKNLSSISFDNVLDTSLVTNMSCMFSGCCSLKRLDFSGFTTEKVEIMQGMFSDCTALETAELKSFHTFNVKNMAKMFYNCSNLTCIDLSNFCTMKLRSSYRMFYGCSGLKKADLRNFRLYALKSRDDMFDGCPDFLEVTMKI